MVFKPHRQSMIVTTEKEITGEVARALREQSGLTQKAFWTAMGITQSGGSRYEQVQFIPRPVRILIYTMYVAGIRVDASSKAGTEHLVKLARLQASEASESKQAIGAKIMDAMTHARKASKILAALES